MRRPLLASVWALSAILAAAGPLAAADATWTQIQVVLNDRCIDCHGEKKQKKGLRLDSPEWLMKGSKEGAVVIAGKPDESRLYTLAALPADDDDRMPPKGARLTSAQLDLIRAWITAGATIATAPAEITPPAKPVPTTAVPLPPAPDLPAGVLDQLVQEQILVTSFAGGWLEVNAAHTRNGITENQLHVLAKVAPAVLFLDLAGSGITDRQVLLLKPFSHLQRLHLEHNPLSDAALSNLPALPELAYLNLVGCAVSDAGIGELGRQTSLRALYLWQTKVTPAGMTTLSRDLPGVTVVTGPEGLPTDTLPEKKKRGKK